MSDKLLSNGSQVTNVPCLLLPLLGTTLVVPNVTVAEMAPMTPVQEVAGTPDWFVGFYHWRNQKVPLLSYEVLNGGARYPLNPLGRIAVLNNTGVNPNLPFIAVATQGIPRMARIGEEDIAENDEIARGSFDLMRVKVGVEELVIPDIAALEASCLEVIGE